MMAGVSGEPRPPKTIREFLAATFGLIRARRRWALLPLWVLLAAVGILLALSGGSSLLPVIYLAL
jgi:hypothetical protein